MIKPGSQVLVACEWSGIVRDAFLAKGHHAMSCDILATESPGPHHQGDVREILDEGWDLIIAHPSCQKLCNSGVRWLSHPDDTEKDFWNRREHPRYIGRRLDMLNAANFFKLFLNHDCPRIAVENPIPHGYCKLPQYSQIIHPHYFGDPYKKSTCLWLKGLPLLQRTHTMDPEDLTAETHEMSPGPDRGKKRGKTYLQFAKQMAEQWTA